MPATNEQIKSFIKEFSVLCAVECNKRIKAGKGFPLLSVAMAQAAHETGWGLSSRMVKANAYFGIKAGGSWTGPIFRADTWEVAPNGEAYNTKANFRAYNSKAESIADYFNLIGGASRYSNALSYGADSSKWKSERETVTAIWSGGYATDSLYVNKIMNMINGRNMTAYNSLITGEYVEGGETGGETGGTVPEGVTLPDLSKTFNGANLTVGALQISDGGRSIQNVSSPTNGLAINWDNAFTVLADSSYTLNADFSVPDDSYFAEQWEIYIVTLKDDTPSVSGPYFDGASLNFTRGTKVGFYIQPSNAEMEPLDKTKITVTFNNLAGEEISRTAIAHFVKIE